MTPLVRDWQFSRSLFRPSRLLLTRMSQDDPSKRICKIHGADKTPTSKIELFNKSKILSFLSENARQSLYNQALRLHDKICTHREGATFYKSQQHNLPFERHYRLLHFDDIPGRKINAQNFVDYGGRGHELTYFINNENIPSFVHRELISHISRMEPVQNLAAKKSTPLNWRFTFNVYKEQDAKQAGFGWHKDIAANGDITSITSIIGNATFQIRPEGQSSCSSTYSLTLTPGSIVLMSGDFRWKWEHRILPQETSTTDGIGRISLVLGCR